MYRRYRVELLWVAFAAANYAAMIAWPSWETIPFHFVWISLTLLYGFRVWPMRGTLVILAGVIAVTSASIGLDAFEGIQLWGELFENAVKYTQPQAAIELRARGDGPGHVLIEVEDEGCGVPEEALARIFDRFARADPARTRSAGGVGLGLAIVDAIAKAHGGSCTVTSTAQGSIFALRLPDFTATAPRLAAPPLVTPVR